MADLDFPYYYSKRSLQYDKKMYLILILFIFLVPVFFYALIKMK